MMSVYVRHNDVSSARLNQIMNNVMSSEYVYPDDNKSCTVQLRQIVQVGIRSDYAQRVDFSSVQRSDVNLHTGR